MASIGIITDLTPGKYTESRAGQKYMSYINGLSILVTNG